MDVILSKLNKLESIEKRMVDIEKKIDELKENMMNIKVSSSIGSPSVGHSNTHGL